MSWTYFKDHWPDEDKALWIYNPQSQLEKIIFIGSFSIIPGVYDDSWQWKYAYPPPPPEKKKHNCKKNYSNYELECFEWNDDLGITSCLPGGNRIVLQVDYCPICGYTIKDDV